MAAVIYPEITKWGNITVYLSVAAAAPSAAGDGTFEVGDWVINSAPAAGGAGISHWICTTRGAGGTAVFTAVTLS